MFFSLRLLNWVRILKALCRLKHLTLGLESMAVFTGFVCNPISGVFVIVLFGY